MAVQSKSQRDFPKKGKTKTITKFLTSPKEGKVQYLNIFLFFSDRLKSYALLSISRSKEFKANGVYILYY